MTNSRPEPAAKSPNASASDRSDALRIVLFGMPQAGKSSLLGALAQAANTQESALGGRLADPTHGLGELQHRVYDEQPRETLEEIVPYPVEFAPSDGVIGQSAQRRNLLLFDCDGRVANDVLSRRRGIGDDAPAGSLPAAVTEADTLILVVDAGASPKQLDTDLGEFVRFLRLLRRERGERSEVGGLPVFLVLSKCDLLAHDGDTLAAWHERIEARLADVSRRFRSFLDDDDSDDDDAIPFGDLDFSVAATAVKQPELSGTLGRPREPWGVAELFHRAFAAANLFRIRSMAAQRRLFWTMLSSGAFVGALILFGAGLYWNRSSTPTVALAAKVESYRAREGQTPSVRLTEPLQRKIGELSDLIGDADAAKLTTDQQQYLKARLAELEAYRGYKEKLLRLRPPAEARSLEDLAEQEGLLLTELAPPPSYASEWRQTDASLLHDKWLDDIKALQKAATDIRDWYEQLVQKGNRLLLFAERTADNAPLPWSQWHDRVGALLTEASRPSFRPQEKLRDSRDLPTAPAVTYATALSFPTIETAKTQWNKVSERLERLRDITQALGLSGDVDRKAVLRLAETPRFAADQTGEVLRNLRQTFPRYSDWTLSDLPDAAAPEIRLAAQTSYQRAIAAGQDVIKRHYLGQFPDGPESHQRWLAIANWLSNAGELREWRELVAVLLRLSQPGAEDPVAALDAYLRRDRFDIDLRSLRLTIPDDLKDQRFRPQGLLVISVQDADRSVRKINFRSQAEGVHDPRLRFTTYSLAVEGTSLITMRPGDIVWADVSLRDAAGGEWQLSWWSNGSRSATYQIERLFLPPRLHRAGQPIEQGDLATGVTLTPIPERGLPRLPDLLPAMR